MKNIFLGFILAFSFCAMSQEAKTAKKNEIYTQWGIKFPKDKKPTNTFSLGVDINQLDVMTISPMLKASFDPKARESLSGILDLAFNPSQSYTFGIGGGLGFRYYEILDQNAYFYNKYKINRMFSLLGEYNFQHAKGEFFHTITPGLGFKVSKDLSLKTKYYLDFSQKNKKTTIDANSIKISSTLQVSPKHTIKKSLLGSMANKGKEKVYSGDLGLGLVSQINESLSTDIAGHFKLDSNNKFAFKLKAGISVPF